MYITSAGVFKSVANVMVLASMFIFISNTILPHYIDLPGRSIEKIDLEEEESNEESNEEPKEESKANHIDFLKYSLNRASSNQLIEHGEFTFYFQESYLSVATPPPDKTQSV